MTRQFRDLALEDYELWCRVNEHICKHYDQEGYGYGVKFTRFEARAKRLLPLWRQLGIEHLVLWGFTMGVFLDMEIDHVIMPSRLELVDRLKRLIEHGRLALHQDATVRFVLKSQEKYAPKNPL